MELSVLHLKVFEKIFWLGVTLFVFNIANAQQIFKKDTTDLTFTGTKISPYLLEKDTTGKIELSGYIDTYYAGYTDTSGRNGGFAKFPTAAPRPNQFGLNIAQVSAKYYSKNYRGVATLFFGDTPKSCWSPHYNYIQEANLGFRIVGKLWLDAGFFRTHIGLESIQPRENIAMSFATTTFYEPYYMSGAKLTWEQSKKWVFQLNAFNGFNNFVENNNNKAFGASVAYTPNDKLSVTYSSLVCDESPLHFPRKRTRMYNNLIAVYKTKRLTIGLEGNYGIQTNSVLKDTTKTAFMFSSLVALKYRFTAKWAGYVRGEYFSDPNEILTGAVFNSQHALTGLDIYGGTFGIEYKPIPNSYMRIETRRLETVNNNEDIFYYHSQSSTIRYELIVGVGMWF